MTPKPGSPTVYLSASEAAEYIGLTLGTVTSYIRRGYFAPHDAVIGRNRGWLPTTLDNWTRNRPGQGARTDRPPKTSHPNPTAPRRDRHPSRKTTP